MSDNQQLTPGVRGKIRAARREEIVDFFEAHTTDLDHAQLYRDLIVLTEEQLREMVVAIHKGYPIRDIAHDLTGIANHEECFVPRIHNLAKVTA